MNEIDTHGRVLSYDFHPDFTHDRLCHSDMALKCGITNVCPSKLQPNLASLSRLLGGVQALFTPHAIEITSGYRCAELNTKVGGVETSQHTLGLAADWVCPKAGTPWELAKAVAESNLQFDQLILEFNRWVHISAAPQDREPRREILSIFSGAEGYLDGLHKRE